MNKAVIKKLLPESLSPEIDSYISNVFSTTYTLFMRLCVIFIQTGHSNIQTIFWSLQKKRISKEIQRVVTRQ